MTYMFPPRLFGESAPSFPVVSGRTDGQGTHTGLTNYNATLPSGIVAGELLVVSLTCTTNSSGIPTINVPSGWTDLFNGMGGFHRHRAIYKTASGSEGASVAVQLGTIGTTVYHTHVAYRIGLWGAIQAATTAASLNPPSVSPAWGTTYGSLFLPLIGGIHNASIASFTPPTNYTDMLSRIYNTVSSVHMFSGGSERLLMASSEDPSAYTPETVLSATSNTIAIRGA